MKNSLKTTILTFAGACFLFQACDTSVTRVTYVPDHDGVSFLQSSISDTEIEGTTWSFDIARARAESELTVALTVEGDIEGLVASSVTFTAGEYTAQISVDVSGLDIGVNVSGTVAITAGQDCYDTNTAITSVSLTLQRAYTWVSLGTGEWYDTFMLIDVLDVEVAKADGFDVYRVYDPWPTDAVLDEDNWGDSLEAGSVPSYIDFTVNNDGSISYGNTTLTFSSVTYSVIATGYNYGDYGQVYFIPPTILSLSGDSYTTEEGNIFRMTWGGYLASGNYFTTAISGFLALPSYSGSLKDYINSQ